MTFTGKFRYPFSRVYPAPDTPGLSLVTSPESLPVLTGRLRGTSLRFVNEHKELILYPSYASCRHKEDLGEKRRNGNGNLERFEEERVVFRGCLGACRNFQGRRTRIGQREGTVKT